MITFNNQQNAKELYEYTLMPSRMTSRFSISELTIATLTNPFNFTKGAFLLKFKPRPNEDGETIELQGLNSEDTHTKIYNLHTDSSQQLPIKSFEIEALLVATVTHIDARN